MKPPVAKAALIAALLCVPAALVALASPVEQIVFYVH
jgi:hypothetical protein